MKEKSILCFAGLNDYTGKRLKEFWNDYKNIITPFIERASSYFQINVSKMIQKAISTKCGELNNLERVIIAYICDCSIYKSYILNGICIETMIGYSAGLNTALVCGGYLAFEDGLKIIKCVDNCFNYAEKKLSQGMATVVGLDRHVVEQMISENNLSNISIGNESSETCIMVGGDKKELEKFCILAVEQGALKVNNLNVPFAFHHQQNEEWMCDFLAELKHLEIKQGRAKIFSVYSNNYISKEKEIIEEIIINTYTAMNWRQSIEYLEKEGFLHFWDISLDGKIKKVTVLNQKSTIHIFDKAMLDNSILP